MDVAVQRGRSPRCGWSVDARHDVDGVGSAWVQNVEVTIDVSPRGGAWRREDLLVPKPWELVSGRGSSCRVRGGV